MDAIQTINIGAKSSVDGKQTCKSNEKEEGLSFNQAMKEAEKKPAKELGRKEPVKERIKAEREEKREQDPCVEAPKSDAEAPSKTENPTGNDLEERSEPLPESTQKPEGEGFQAALRIPSQSVTEGSLNIAAWMSKEEDGQSQVQAVKPASGAVPPSGPVQAALESGTVEENTAKTIELEPAKVQPLKTYQDLAPKEATPSKADLNPSQTAALTAPGVEEANKTQVSEISAKIKSPSVQPLVEESTTPLTQEGPGKTQQAQPGLETATRWNQIPSDKAEFQRTILNQIEGALSRIQGEGRIQLEPRELGLVQIQTLDDGKLRVTVTENQVQKALQQAIEPLKNILQGAGGRPDSVQIVKETLAQPIIGQVAAGGETASSTNDGNLSQGFDQFKEGDNVNQAGRTSSSITQSDSLETTRWIQEISSKHQIRDLHSHILDQIRMKMDGIMNEARIRLHPPELGEIRIHMVMDDRNLTVRIDTTETMVKSLLERDLQQLKNTLSDAGIDVARFDINSGGESRYRQWTGFSESAPATGDLESAEGEGETEHWNRTQGSVRISGGSGTVDYMVY